ncbi:MAG: class I SAM-dependent methyltransferase [Nitrospirae bacterium]|nr:class I SAM-dependent methyltransferase [Nitrospirota bacterium]
MSEPGYQLIDSGGGRRLERVGPHLLVRPSLQAVWAPALPDREWKRADAVYERAEGQKDRWQGTIPERWTLAIDNLSFQIRATDFGHLGLFPEQRANWQWIAAQVARARKDTGTQPRVLNLFAYTGGSTLAALAAGAAATHVDAARGVVQWARDNAALTGVEGAPCRWIVEDVLKYVRRAGSRGERFEGIILDPPTFGRGSKGEVWKIEPEIVNLLAQCRQLLNPDGGFVLFSCHTPGFSPIVMQNLTEGAMRGLSGAAEYAEMRVPERDTGRFLPSGVCARWSSL